MEEQMVTFQLAKFSKIKRQHLLTIMLELSQSFANYHGVVKWSYSPLIRAGMKPVDLRESISPR